MINTEQNRQDRQNIWGCVCNIALVCDPNDSERVNTKAGSLIASIEAVRWAENPLDLDPLGLTSEAQRLDRWTREARNKGVLPSKLESVSRASHKLYELGQFWEDKIMAQFKESSLNTK